MTENPVKLTHSVRDALTRVTCGGAPVYVWPGGGITIMVDVSRMPENAFGYVPTPALVAPIEFTLKLSDYATLGGYMDHVRPLSSIQQEDDGATASAPRADNPWPLAPAGLAADEMNSRAQIRMLPDGRRLHLHDGPIDIDRRGIWHAVRNRSRHIALRLQRFVDRAGRTLRRTGIFAPGNPGKWTATRTGAIARGWWRP